MNFSDLVDTSNWTGACTLPDVGVVEATGPDAAAFLHGQLSQDMLSLAVGHSALAAYCSAKGRMLASLWVQRLDAERFALVMDQAILPATLKRLSMFVLRAQCKLRDASADWRVLGTVAPVHHTFAAPWADTPGQSLTGTGSRLGWAIVSEADADALTSSPDTADPAVVWVSGAHWAWLSVLTGVPRITANTIDQFVPQMVNMELIGGVNFQKGCYPGQEVVARSQYRGTTKRRLFLLEGVQPMQAGQEIFTPQEPEQPVGMVVNAAACPVLPQRWHALAELKLSAQAAPLCLGHASGPSLSVRPLPYDVPTATASTGAAD